MFSLSIGLASVFAALAAMHAYWAFGGRWAGAAAIPKTNTGQPVFSPGPIACLAVALGLLVFAYAPLAHAAIVPAVVPRWIWRVILWTIFGLFTARTIGDFRFVGITRRVTGTDFAKYDRLIYTPLCLGIAAGALGLILLARR